CVVASWRRSGYLRLSRNFSVSTGRTSEPISARPSASSSESSRARAPMRRWCAHLGQTWRLVSRSAEYSTVSQDGHLTHTPSGTRLPLPLGFLIRGGSSLSSQLIVASPSFSWLAG